RHLRHARRVDPAQVVQRAHGVRGPDLELAVDVQLVDVVDHLEQVDVLDLPHGLDRPLERGLVVDQDVEVADDVVRPHPHGPDVAQVGARVADRGGEAAEDAGSVRVAATQRTEQIGHGARSSRRRRGGSSIDQPRRPVARPLEGLGGGWYSSRLGKAEGARGAAAPAPRGILSDRDGVTVPWWTWPLALVTVAAGGTVAVAVPEPGRVRTGGEGVGDAKR